jgi:flagellar biosynthetic protein FlhB
VSLGGGVLGLVVGLPWLGEAVLGLARSLLARSADTRLVPADVPLLVRELLIAVGPGVMLVLVPAALLGIGVSLVTTGFNISVEALEPKLERIDPMSGLTRFVSPQSLQGALKSFLVLFLVGWSAWSAMAPYMDYLPAAATLSASSQIRLLAELGRSLLTRATVAALTIGAADFGFQKWNLSRQMRMSKQEIKEEHKDSEGDPLVRAARRRRARQLATRKMLTEVPKADVIETNPTHYAVALRYRKAENAAPVVVARGVDHMAMHIRSLASKNDIPIIENRPLARALYAQAKVGVAIPKEFYGPVAQVLAVIYRRRRKPAPAPALPPLR